MGELADRYAQAFLEVGGDGAELARCAQQLEGEKTLWAALISPAVEPEEKRRVLARLPEVAPPDPVGRLLSVMAEKERLPLLPEVVQSTRRLALERDGGALGRMTCARPLTEDQLERIKETLCRLHHLKKVELEVQVDPALLGGLRLELQGITYDKSVRGGLDALARTLGEGRSL
mgnify:CR=1 FL=1